jgi:hypothetical protein
MSESTIDIRTSLIEWGNTNKNCPCCGNPVGDGVGVGDGSKENGVFCSLDCYTLFYFTDMSGCKCVNITSV